MGIRKALVSAGIIAVLLIAALLATLPAAWRVAYSPVPPPPGGVAVPALEGGASITWGQAGDAQIDAADRQAATAGLGFVHAWNHATMMVLLRHAALGRLSEWLGREALPADSLARSLGLAPLAEASITRLSPGDRDHLAAYAHGVNAAWDEPSTTLRQAFQVLDYAPEPWLPWHTLAIERLIAYLAAELDCTPAPAFCRADRALREMMHIHGFGHSLAWVARRDTAAVLYQRHVYGDTALPLFQEVVMRTPGRSPVLGITLIGTPFFVGGQSRHGSWAVLLESDAHLVRGMWSLPPVRYERLRDSEGNEYLVPYVRNADQLLAALSDSATTWVLGWSGLLTGSDVGAWRALPEGRAEPFTMFSGPQLRVSAYGGVRELGVAPVRITSPHGILISRDSASLDLSAPDTSWLRTAAWLADTRSNRAAAVLPALLARLDEFQVPRSAQVERALVYLKNWDHHYARESIGSSLFAAWAVEYAAATGSPLDASADDAGLLLATLVRAVQTLTEQYGSSQGAWVWGELNPDRRHFAVTRAREGIAVPPFKPLEWPGQGHASAPRWGPSSFGSDGLAAPATIELWHSPRWRGRYQVRRRLSPMQAPLPEHTGAARDVPLYSLPSPPAHITAMNQ